MTGAHVDGLMSRTDTLTVCLDRTLPLNLKPYPEGVKGRELVKSVSDFSIARCLCRNMCYVIGSRSGYAG